MGRTNAARCAYGEQGRVGLGEPQRTMSMHNLNVLRLRDQERKAINCVLDQLGIAKGQAWAESASHHPQRIEDLPTRRTKRRVGQWLETDVNGTSRIVLAPLSDRVR